MNIKQWEETPLSIASKKECLRVRTLRLTSDVIIIGDAVEAFTFQTTVNRESEKEPS